MRRMIGAILRVTVPATIIRSDWRGDARKTPAPKRSMSYRDDTVAIIAMAQQASPNVIGQRDPLRHQLMAASRVVVTMLASSDRSISPINSYSAGRSSLPARLFSFGLLDVPQYACVILICEKPRRTSVSTGSLRN